MTAAQHTAVHGYVSKGFEVVRDAFHENFSRRKELGAACCVYRHGEKVVDLWGGVRNKATGEPWHEDMISAEQAEGVFMHFFGHGHRHRHDHERVSGSR